MNTLKEANFNSKLLNTNILNPANRSDRGNFSDLNRKFQIEIVKSIDSKRLNRLRMLLTELLVKPALGTDYSSTDCTSDSVLL